MNILFLSSWYPNSELPFNGNFVQQHARAVAERTSVAVLHIQSRNQTQKFVIETQLNEGVYEVIVYFKNKKSFKSFDLLRKIVVQTQALFKGYAVVNQYFKTKIDVVHLNVIVPLGWFALFLNKRFQIPYIITEHHTKFLQIRKEKFNFWERLMIKQIVVHAEKVCPVSHNLQQAFEKQGFNGNFEVVPNVVNEHYFYSQPKNFEQKFEILHVSSLQDEHKNVTGILRVFRKLTDSHPNIFLRIIGDGNHDKVKRYASQIGLNPNTYSVEGPMHYAQIADAMRQAHLFLLFSNYENLPCVIAESLVCGTPVLATKVGGIPEMIDSTNGMLIDVKDEVAFFEKLDFLIKNQNQYDNVLISKNAIEKYSYQKVSEQFLNIYTNILEKRETNISEL